MPRRRVRKEQVTPITSLVETLMAEAPAHAYERAERDRARLDAMIDHAARAKLDVDAMQTNDVSKMVHYATIAEGLMAGVDSIFRCDLRGNMAAVQHLCIAAEAAQRVYDGRGGAGDPIGAAAAQQVVAFYGRAAVRVALAGERFSAYCLAAGASTAAAIGGVAEDAVPRVVERNIDDVVVEGQTRRCGPHAKHMMDLGEVAQLY